MSDPLDEYINVVSKTLGLTIDDAWKPSVRANLQVTLKFAQTIDEFALPDEMEPASVYSA